MAIIKLTPHFEYDTSTVDVQFSDNPFGTWTSLITDDPVSQYPKKFSDNRITDITYIRFRVKNTLAEYSDWSTPRKGTISEKPEPHKDLCFVWDRIKDYNTQEPLNSQKVRFEYKSGTAGAGVPLVRDITPEGDNYGWFGVYLTPGITYTVTCLEASIKRDIVIPTQKNVRLGTL